ncbi:MAG: helix-turn-helix transcriptional regulator [Marvinbryantia sp.]|uniref:helix-turn-helix transcriptional regulator n=1 Tax=Marvinbryantia sp. TaxID=2496532 RepID=UPI00399B1308
MQPCALSGVFSKTFHTNFNGYLNDVRLDYVCHLLRHTDQSITEAYENAGFSSQRTFNRVFQERFRMTPREYRRLNQAAPSGEHTVSPQGQWAVRLLLHSENLQGCADGKESL